MLRSGKISYEKIKLVDEDWVVSLAEVKRPDQEGYIIATKELTEAEHWKNFECGELLYLQRERLSNQINAIFMYYNKQRALKLRNAQEVRVDWGKGNYIKKYTGQTSNN